MVEKQLTKNTFIRIFKPQEYYWHQDNENRLVIPLIHNNWKIQIDNELPVDFNKPFFIPKLKWHKIIPGNGLLMIKLLKLNFFI